MKFTIPNEHNKFLGKILENIDLNPYIVKIYDDQVFVGTKFLFSKDQYEGAEFKKIIDNKVLYYSLFVNLEFFYHGNDMRKVDTISDVLSKRVSLVLIIIDGRFVEVYSMNKELLQHIFQNAVNNDFKDLTDITDINFKNKTLCAM